MKTIKLFIWFAVRSWHYMRKQRWLFFSQFIYAWHIFYDSAKEDGMV